MAFVTNPSRMGVVTVVWAKPPMRPTPPKTFAELYCEQQAIRREDFEHALVERALQPQARALRRLLELLPGDFFAADLELARNVGRLTRSSDFAWEIADFHAHPGNRRALRRRLKVRLSIARLRHIVNRTFGDHAAQTKKTAQVA
jgi:hypothetical protein